MADKVVKLRGMTWDHPRGLAPLQAASRMLKAKNIDIVWDARSLQGFEEASIAKLAVEYDLIAIDHPFVGMAYEQGALQPVDALLGVDFMRELRAASVGPSYESYVWKDALWAVPVDAAAQVAASRTDLLALYGQQVPETWDHVFTLARVLPMGVKIGMPANSTHILLAFATICHAVAHDKSLQPDLRPRWWTDDGFDPQTAMHGLDIMRRLMDVAHPLSWKADPIQIFEHMVRCDDLVYTPIAFGYSNYARPEAVSHPLRFRAVPSINGSTGGGMLGGVGLAVSKQCSDSQAAAQVLRYVAGADMQRGLYLDAGGQPAHREAWTDARTTVVCPDFFDVTLPSLDRSFVRPRLPAFPTYQREGGKLLHTLFQQGTVRDAHIIEALNQLWQQVQKY